MKINYKGIEFSTDSKERNYIEPTIPNLSKKCKNCDSVMEIRPLDVPFLKTAEGIYLVHRTERGILMIKNDIPVNMLYGCKDCSHAESVRLEGEKFIEV